MKLQLFLSHNGVCSRRDAMSLIQEGRAKVNGELVWEPSTFVNPHEDTIEVDGVAVEKKQYVYLLMNKPAGYVTTTEDEHAPRTVMELLPPEYQHLNPVGRLDEDTEGLLLFTNDGDVAYKLTHPKFNVDKIYFVTLDGVLQPKEQRSLEEGILLDGKITVPAKVRAVKTLAGRSEFELTIHEGRKRQIRLMAESLGHKVLSLKRIVQGPLRLVGLKAGSYRTLTSQEVEALKKL